jgi:hypothetical protein
VLVDLAATADLDVTTTDMLFELVGDLRSRSIEVLVAQVRGTVRDRLRKTGLMDALGEDRVYLSIGSAVNDFGRRWPPERDVVIEPEPAAAPDVISATGPVIPGADGTPGPGIERRRE